MAKKIKFWDYRNIKVSVKGLAVSLLTSLVLLLPIAFLEWVIEKIEPTSTLTILLPALLLSLVIIGAYLTVWGYFGRRFWRWN